jgi:hypothetical protein
VTILASSPFCGELAMRYRRCSCTNPTRAIVPSTRG